MLRRLIIALLAICAVAVVRPATAEPVFPPGLRIGLEPPGDLKPSTHFSGFEDVGRKVAITILDLPAAAYGGLEQAANAENQHGLADFKREDFSFPAAKGCWSPAASRSKTACCTNGFCWRARPPSRT